LRWAEATWFLMPRATHERKLHSLLDSQFSDFIKQPLSVQEREHFNSIYYG